jgi:dienelactone hydrolase
MSKLSRNGRVTNTNCVRTGNVHNVEGNDSSDVTYIRFINDGSAALSNIRGTLYDTNGDPIGEPNVQLFDELGPREAIFLSRGSISAIIGDTWTGAASLVLSDTYENLKLMNLNFVNDETFFNFSCYEGAAMRESDAVADYDPAQVIASSQAVSDTVVFDNNRDREIPTLIYLPEDASPRPIVLFSHGNGLNRFISSYLGEHWSDRGYIVVAMQHPGSDSESGPDMSIENLVLRVEDVGAIIDQLEIWADDPSHNLYGRLDLDKIGMAGHSFGAKTTQAVSGQVISYLTEEISDPRIKAALALSPSLEGELDPVDQFSAVNMPWMLMTGTEESSLEERLSIYPALPPGGKYELVLSGGEHLAFTDVTALSVLEMLFTRNPAHHPEIAALSTAFWDSWLLGDSAARVWLEGDGALTVLQPQDTWQLK